MEVSHYEPLGRRNKVKLIVYGIAFCTYDIRSLEFYKLFVSHFYQSHYSGHSYCNGPFYITLTLRSYTRHWICVEPLQEGSFLLDLGALLA